MAALSSTQATPALSRWSERVGRLASECGKVRAARRVGIIYTDGLEAQAALVADVGSKDLGDTSFDSLATSAAGVQDSNVFADWLFGCDRVVIVADCSGIVQTLTTAGPLHRCLQLHPNTSLVLSGLDASSATVGSFSGLLREALSALGLPTSSLADTHGWVTSADTLLSSDAEAMEFGSRNDDSAMLLVSAMRAMILCAESGGSSAFAPASQRLDSPETAAATDASSATLMAILDSTSSEDPDSLSPLSKHIQDSFVKSDLLAVDSSNGAVKHRIRTWFASGKIWQAVLMRVYEVSDSLIDDAIHERSLEEAELGMIHAAGRLNESVRHTASKLASRLDRLHQTDKLRDAELVSARSALQALAAQNEAVDRFVLARLVWKSRESLESADECLEQIPGYIRWSLAQFWTINAGAIAGVVASVAYFNTPLAYAASGGLALSMLAFVWLGRRWRTLEANIYRHLDARYAAMRAELVDAHRQALLAHLDRPVLACTKRLTAAASSSENSFGLSSAWKSRLAAIVT
ncbi:hypothetical protein GGF42_000478 [Coemansia sp. RSA 2424]|nr:hypothetical protein GGF42_000478 [Coemansia sp. RSA 2424]